MEQLVASRRSADLQCRPDLGSAEHVSAALGRLRAQEDDDHDDLGVRVVFRPMSVSVPEPGSLGLMLVGLLSVAGIVRHRQRESRRLRVA